MPRALCLIAVLRAWLKPGVDKLAVLTNEQIFTLELAFNAFGHWFWWFVSDGWSIFDFAVISISIIALVFDAIPGISILRTVRAFRILRLIGRSFS